MFVSSDQKFRPEFGTEHSLRRSLRSLTYYNAELNYLILSLHILALLPS